MCSRCRWLSTCLQADQVAGCELLCRYAQGGSAGCAGCAAADWGEQAQRQASGVVATAHSPARHRAQALPDARLTGRVPKGQLSTNPTTQVTPPREPPSSGWSGSI
jgi:hypothetical protein